ncbi:hypothetical protein CRYUN_Cryun24cG0106500 [Craigia yunnanensis]
MGIIAIVIAVISAKYKKDNHLLQNHCMIRDLKDNAILIECLMEGNLIALNN